MIHTDGTSTISNAPKRGGLLDPMLGRSAQEINILVNLCGAENDRWWRDPETGEPVERNIGELLMLAVSELAEGMEGERKNLMDDKLPHRRMLEVELADCLIRIFDTASHFCDDLGGAFAEKLEFNRTRADHDPANRLKEGGKRF